jgi:hypothetical protein
VLSVRFRDRLMNRAMTALGRKRQSCVAGGRAAPAPNRPAGQGGRRRAGRCGLNYLPMEGIRGLLQAAPQLVFLMPDKWGYRA